MTAGREDRTAGALGRLRTSRAEREQAVDVLKAAFIQGRLAKGEFDLRVSQALASRTYADLAALTADIPDGITSALPAAEPAQEPGSRLSVKTAARVGAVGAIPSTAAAATVLLQAGGVPALAGVLFVGLTGLLVTGLLTAALVVLSWAVRRSRQGTAQGPPSGPARPGSRRPALPRQPPPRRNPWPTAEAVRVRLCY